MIYHNERPSPDPASQRVISHAVIAALGALLFLGLLSDASAQVCSCASLQPDQMAWKAQINDAGDEWHLVAELNATFRLDCGPGSRRDDCFANAQLVPKGASYQAVDANGTVIDSKILKSHFLLFDSGTTGNMAGSCGRTSSSRHKFRYIALLEKVGEADQIADSTLFWLNTGCGVLDVGFATPHLVVDTRSKNRKVIDYDLSNLDGDALTGFSESLVGTSDQDWDTDGDGVGDDDDEAPTNRKCHTEC